MFRKIYKQRNKLYFMICDFLYPMLETFDFFFFFFQLNDEQRVPFRSIDYSLKNRSFFRTSNVSKTYLSNFTFRINSTNNIFISIKKNLVNHVYNEFNIFD